MESSKINDNTQQFKARALVRPEGGYLTAQCLEYDIAVQASTFQELKRRLSRMLTAHIVLALENGEPPFSTLGKAPAYFWEKWQESAGEEQGMLFHLNYTDDLTAWLSQTDTPAAPVSASAEMLVA